MIGFIVVSTLIALSNAGLIGNGIDNGDDKPNLGIVNGVKSTKVKPWICSLRVNGFHICGCSILDDHTILTAAHCLQAGLSASNYQIGVGDIELTKHKLYQVKYYVNHPQYSNGKTYNYDVAILTTSSSIVFQLGKVSKLNLIQDCTNLPYGSDVSVQGWGTLESGGAGATVLYETNVKLLRKSDEGCSYYDYYDLLSDTMICAGGGNTDSCQGDSGGPLTNKFGEQIGIVSWGFGCAQPGIAGIYTNVCVVKSWIANPSGPKTY